MMARISALQIPFRRKCLFSMSLIELLAVMAVVAILVGVLIPALMVARDRGRRAACTSNLKQLGVVVQSYLDDHKDVYPPCLDYVPWRGTYYPGGVAALVNIKPQDIQACFTNYSLATNSSVWVCPTARQYAYPAQPAGLGKFAMPDAFGYRNNITYRWNSLRTRSSLSMNTNNLADMGSYPKTSGSVKRPADAALMWDLPDDLPTYNKPDLHQGKVNCLFVDGHVELISAIAGSAPKTLWWYAGNGAGEGWGD
jgi:prepilin-type processing-associated H-X9-DG protein